MSDLERGDIGGPANQGFREAYAAAERTAAEEAGLLEAEAPTEAETPVAEGDTPVAEAPADDSPEATIAALKAELAAKEARIADQDSMIGRQSAEVSELRRSVEDRFTELDNRVNQPQPVRQQITPDFIEQNPGAATQAAFEQGDTYTLQAAFEQWKLEDPGSAAVWATTKQAEERERNLVATYDKRFAELEQKFVPLAAQSQEQELQRAVLGLPDDVKTFLADTPTIEALASEFPTLGKTIASGAPAERIEAVRALHDIHRGRVSDTLSKTEQEVARSTAEEAQAMRDEAYVASSTASQEQPKTLEQIEQEKAVAAFGRKQSTWDDAFVRPGKK